MAKQVDKLPNKPSELIRLAIKDLNAVEKTKGYSVNMGAWHYPTYAKGKASCQVCFAGSVIARTLETSKDTDSDPDTFTEFTRSKLYFLDRIRAGYFDDNYTDWFYNKFVKAMRKKLKAAPVNAEITKLQKAIEGLSPKAREVIEEHNGAFLDDVQVPQYEEYDFVEKFYEQFDIPLPPSYAQDKPGFKKAILKLADAFEKVGL